MSTREIPDAAGRIRQLNTGDVLGELWSTYNVDISTSPNKIRLSKPVEEVLNGTELQNARVQALELAYEDLYVLTSDQLFRIRDLSSPTANSPANTVSSGEDMEFFTGLLLISDNDTVDSYDESNYTDDWWNSISGTVLQTGYPHLLHVIRSSGQDTLVVTDKNSVRYYNSDAGHTQVSWDQGQVACCLASGLNTGWVGTYNETGRNAEVYSFQVGNDQYSQAYPVDGRAVLAITVKDNVPYIVTETGKIQRFNQAGFTTIATLPMLNTEIFLQGAETGNISPNNTSRPIHPKGMKFNNDKLYIYVNAEAAVGQGNVNERMNGGVYEVDVNTGSVTHRFAPESGYPATSSPLFTINDHRGRFYFGSNPDKIGSNTVSLMREDLNTGSSNTGYLVTTEHHSGSYTDIFSNLNLATQLKENDRIVVKYRTEKLDPVKFDIAWTNATEFTTPDDVSELEIGWEVELYDEVTGYRSAHVVSITPGTTTIVTVDEEIGVTGRENRAQALNFKKLEEITAGKSIYRVKADQIDTKIQYKLYLEGTNIEIDRLISKSTVKEQLK